MDGTSKMRAILGTNIQIITYSPRESEVQFQEFLPHSSRSILYKVSPDPAIDPFIEAERVRKLAGNNPVAIFTPGKAFDQFGTRHGRGGGWYDRFLSNVPREWLRIGFCYGDQFSMQPLSKESWDQSMDHIVVVDRTSGTLTLYSAERNP